MARQPDGQDDAFAAWARDHAVPLPDCSSPSYRAAMAPILSMIGKARVVALGEPGHGAHEPLAFRNCLFRALVEQGGFTAIAIESGISESRRLHDYAAGGPGDIRRLLPGGLTWGFGRYPENGELIDWIRRYNADRGAGRKIGFYGFDMSGGEASGLWRNAAGTLRDGLAYLERAAPDRSLAARQAITPLVDRFSHDGHAALAPRDRTRLRRAIAGLIGFFDRHRAALIAASTRADYDWARNSMIAARQLEALFGAVPPEAPGATLSPNLYRADAVRDAAMAENVRWVLDREGPAGRVLVFAHNGHVVNAPLRGGIWSVYAQAPKAMGQHLRAALGKDLLIVAASSAASPPADMPDAQPPGSLDAALSAAGRGDFILDLRTARTAPRVSSWLARDRTIRANFTTEMLMAPASAFDAVVVFDRLSPVVRIVTAP
ncbi:erythromycin esterase family protein [Sphingomonas colocasiae]|uniref:Erythromycin esterase family protein n=2 Tax=Sphingomonas colocasiae TaxID=1848973 RepID=A0ABS7PRH7_9SPHN|nr:erythromycin esterase family protein [Sphingomonas colocasiae]MBY8823833.1 erythromycin esterase family protein [Sphingomonas colocasiae]